MRNIFLLSLGLVLSTGYVQAADGQDTLFQFRGKTVTAKELSPALQQALYEIDRQRFQNATKVMDAYVLEQFVNEESKKKNLTVEQFEQQMFKGKKVGEKEAKEWFESNKARLGGREFTALKNDIVQLLQSQEDEKVRTTVLAKIKQDGKFQLQMTEPQAPKVEIASQGFPSKGTKTPLVTIVEFADYRCPHCKDASMSLKAVVEKFKDKVQLVYLDFPLDRGGVARTVADGAVCADQQNKFWDYHYMAFNEQGSLATSSPAEFAKKLKLDSKAFETCLKADQTKKKVDMARAEGERVGVDGTPAIYLNGRKHVGHSEKSLEDAIKKLL